MKKVFVLIVIVICCCCKNNNSITGELYIKLIDLYDFSNISEVKIVEYKNKIKVINEEDFSLPEIKMINYFKILDDNELLNKPHFKIIDQNEKIINVYTNEIEYKKLEKELKNLNRDTEKIMIEFSGIRIPNIIKNKDNIFNREIYYAENITKVLKVKGITHGINNSQKTPKLLSEFFMVFT